MGYEYETESGISYGWWKRKRDEERAQEAERLGDFLKAIKDQPDPPCKGCELRESCKLRKLACRHFSEYAETGKWDSHPRGLPTRDWYEWVNTEKAAVVRTQFAEY